MHSPVQNILHIYGLRSTGSLAFWMYVLKVGEGEEVHNLKCKGASFVENIFYTGRHGHSRKAE